MNSNPIYEQLKNDHELPQDGKDLKTAAEHAAIIQKYRAIGYMDETERQDAIRKYVRFNEEHPDFYEKWNSITTAAKSNANINNVDNAVIIHNLSVQLGYLCGENVFGEGNRNG